MFQPSPCAWSRCRIVSLAITVLLFSSPLTFARAFAVARSQEIKPDASKPAQNPPEVRKLEVGKPIERELGGGESHPYETMLEAGQYVNVIVKQRGIDVKVTVTGPDGKQMFEFNSESRKQGQETVTLVADASGSYHLNVQPIDKQATAGLYEIRVTELRASTEQDRQLQEAHKLYDQSVQLGRKGQYDAALPLGDQALAIREKALGADHPEIADCVSNLALLYRNKGDYAKAELLYRRALAIREKVLGPDHPDVAESLDSFASFYFITEDYAKAEPLYRRALAIWEQALGPDHPGIARTLNNLANLYSDGGDNAKAEPLYQRALAIWEKAFGPDHPNIAHALNNLANLYQDKADYAKAEPFYQRALAIRERVLGPDHPDVARSLNNLANLYSDKGDPAKAKPLYQRALAIREKLLGPDHQDVAEPLNNLAILYSEQRDYAKAEPLFQRVLAIYEKSLGPDRPLLATSLNNLASLYKDKGDPAKAEPLYQRALAIYEKALGPDHPDVAEPLNNLVNLYAEQGDYAKAELLGQRALTVCEKSLGPDHPNVARSLDNLALLYWHKGEPAKAVEYLSRAVKVSERNIALNLSAGSERQKLVYLTTLSGQTNTVISLHAQSAPANAPARNLAVTTVLQRKSRALDAMTDSIAALRRRANPQDRELIDQLTEVRSRLSKLVFGGPGDTKPAEYQAEIKKLEDQVEELEASISRRSTEFRAQFQPVTLEAVRAAIPPQAALVEFVSYRPRNPMAQKAEEIYKEAHYVAYVLVNKSEVQWVHLGAAKQIDDAIKALRAVLRKDEGKPLSNIDREVKPAARKVDELVMEPVRRRLGHTRRVFISPDGALNLIPFGALVDEKGRYLVKRYHFTHVTSGRDLLRLQEHLPSKTGMIIVANPDYGPMSSAAADRGVKSLKPQIVVKGKVTATTKDVPAPTPAPDFSQVEFPPLIGTEQEGLALKAMLPEATTIMGEQATKAAVKQVNAPSILHVATHGFFLEDLVSGSSDTLGVSTDGQPNPAADSPQTLLLHSGLALAGANLHKRDDDGILTALEVSGLNLWGTKLVVLSACETGLGAVKNGNGIFGLRRALFLAGSESQVLSLWKVADEATRDLMIDYYTGLKAGQGRSEALREVQLRMLASKNHQHPYYWASFIESGEWANLDGKR